MKKNLKFVMVFTLMIITNLNVALADWSWPWNRTPIYAHCVYTSTKNYVFFTDTEEMAGKKRFCKDGGGNWCTQLFCEPIRPK